MTLSEYQLEAVDSFQSDSPTILLQFWINLLSFVFQDLGRVWIGPLKLNLEINREDI